MAQDFNKHWPKMCKVLANAVWADVPTWSIASLVGLVELNDQLQLGVSGGQGLGGAQL